MTDKLKNDLLKNNIQCISENDGKFVFVLGVIKQISESDSVFLTLSSLFSSEIPVGSFLIAKANIKGVLKTLVYVCCNASQAVKPVNASIKTKNNLFWLELTDTGVNVKHS